MNFTKTENEIREIISNVSKDLKREINQYQLKFIFNDKGNHKLKTKEGCMYIYSFWHDDFEQPLKIGRAGNKTLPRYKYNHYRPNSSKSNLARSLITDPKTAEKYNLNAENIKEWMHENLYRINIEMPFDAANGFDSFTLELIEAILHYKYKPIFEGRNSQR